jgi:C-terminal processing protease CtpA/Prc
MRGDVIGINSSSVENGSPAEAAGIRARDVILKLNAARAVPAGAAGPPHVDGQLAQRGGRSRHDRRARSGTVGAGQ